MDKNPCPWSLQSLAECIREREPWKETVREQWVTFAHQDGWADGIGQSQWSSFLCSLSWNQFVLNEALPKPYRYFETLRSKGEEAESFKRLNLTVWLCSPWITDCVIFGCSGDRSVFTECLQSLYFSRRGWWRREELCFAVRMIACGPIPVEDSVTFCITNPASYTPFSCLIL